MQLTQIQNEIIDQAKAGKQVQPEDMVRLLLHDLEDVRAAIRDLADLGLLENIDDDSHRLTDRGRAVQRAQEDAHRAAVISQTSSWQRG